MSKAKRLIAGYLNEIGPGTRPVIARHTEFMMNDGDGKPITTMACVNNNRLTVQDFGSEPNETHATQTLCTLMATAPDARVHYAVPTQGCNLPSGFQMDSLWVPFPLAKIQASGLLLVNRRCCL